ncbi:MAG: vanadium-dependent haloperoxidase [Leptolyngbyaceae cyanobacterium SM1_3_5]|nr:vanadium-dependent haloperoxidase [Leptolyngbyaceae cyanobacterium SM1_3_5]
MAHCSKDARTFALLNLGLADAGIAAWDAKYTYNSWRPIDALHLADTDGNPRTKAAPGWNPLISTPNHPDYVSGHSTFSGAASQILTSLFGDRFGFSSGSIGLPGVTRTFNSFRQAANEAGISRIYGGIHTESSNRAGKATGRALADYIVANFLTPI